MLLKNCFILLLCACGTLATAKEALPESIGIIQEIEVKNEWAEIKASASHKINSSTELKDKAYEAIISEETVQKFADETAISQPKKKKVAKSVSKQLKKIGKKLHSKE
jgi:hypothetical protein